VGAIYGIIAAGVALAVIAAAKRHRQAGEYVGFVDFA